MGPRPQAVLSVTGLPADMVYRGGNVTLAVEVAGVWVPDEAVVEITINSNLEVHEVPNLSISALEVPAGRYSVAVVVRSTEREALAERRFEVAVE